MTKQERITEIKLRGEELKPVIGEPMWNLTRPAPASNEMSEDKELRRELARLEALDDEWGAS